jgi:hypothetical protein
MMTLREFAEREFTGLDIVSVSQPEPVLLERNFVGVTDDVEKARAAVVALEDLEIDDARLGLVVLESPHAWGADWHEPGHADPEGATRVAAVRAAIGAVIGAVIGGALIGAIAAAMGGGSTGLAGAVVGAVAGAVLGAIVCVFAGLGGSTAYSDTFVEGKENHLCLVSLHTNDRDEAKAARKRLSGRPWADLFDVDANGKTRRL